MLAPAERPDRGGLDDAGHCWQGPGDDGVSPARSGRCTSVNFRRRTVYYMGGIVLLAAGYFQPVGTPRTETSQRNGSRSHFCTAPDSASMCRLTNRRARQLPQDERLVCVSRSRSCWSIPASSYARQPDSFRERTVSAGISARAAVASCRGLHCIEVCSRCCISRPGAGPLKVSCHCALPGSTVVSWPPGPGTWDPPPV